MSINSISISFSAKDTARADVMLTTTRAYYRFATIDSCEEGEIPFNNALENFSKIKQALNSSDAEPMPQDVKCAVRISDIYNTHIEYNNNNISQSAYNSLINITSRINDEFTFIRGFK